MTLVVISTKLSIDTIFRFFSLVKTLKTLSGYVELPFFNMKTAQVETTVITKQRARDNGQYQGIFYIPY